MQLVCKKPFYQSKDTLIEYLGGDFYWVAQKGNIKFAAVGDCTGHGVPAAFLSMLGYNFLNHAVHNKNLIELDEILIEVDKQLIDAFSTNDYSKYDNDWIDISLISYNVDTYELSFSGANRKIIVINEHRQSIKLKGSNYPLGGWQVEEKRMFPIQKMILYSGEIYLGSDGFQDQFGAEYSKQIGSKKLHQLIKENSTENMTLQKEKLGGLLRNWMGDADQTDDICLVGVRI